VLDCVTATATATTRMGHSSTQAALIHQHAGRDREQAIAAAVSARVKAARPKVDGTTGARAPRPLRNEHLGRRTSERP
jgi:hypothetical protein